MLNNFFNLTGLTEQRRKQWWEDFLRSLPKTDLHIHLDGSLRISTIIELAKRDGIKLPSYTEDGLKDLVFKESYHNLEEYLKTFQVTCSVMMNLESLEQIAYELVMDNINEGVYYIEPRFAPQLFINSIQGMEEIMNSIDRGLKKAADEFNQSDSVKFGDRPPFKYGIIVCAMRSFGPWSDYYRSLFDCMKYSSRKEMSKVAALELAYAAVELRDKKGIPIVALDLAGAEAGNQANWFTQAFEYARSHFLSTTVHAGEAYGAESIFQAVNGLGADRIGHGYSLFNSGEVCDERISDKKKYIDNLVEYIAAKRITIEVCLSSNLQTRPEIGEVKSHSLKKMLDSRLNLSICTDNRLVSHTTVTNELLLIMDNFDLSLEMLKNIVMNGFKRSFFSANYLEKRSYVEKCEKYFDSVVALHTTIK